MVCCLSKHENPLIHYQYKRMLKFFIRIIHRYGWSNIVGSFSYFVHGMEWSSVLKKNFAIFMAPFYGWGSTASRLESLLIQGGSLLFTTKFPEIPGTHFIDLRWMNPWVESHPVLNMGPLDWESSTLTTRPLLHCFYCSTVCNPRKSGELFFNFWTAFAQHIGSTSIGVCLYLCLFN